MVVVVVVAAFPQADWATTSQLDGPHCPTRIAGSPRPTSSSTGPPERVCLGLSTPRCHS